VIEADLLLQVLEIALDAPAEFGDVSNLGLLPLALDRRWQKSSNPDNLPLHQSAGWPLCSGPAIR
jgi:hypothetical protein